jgi:leader peptidase (prepilin peptidase) / N-methyltransferase
VTAERPGNAYRRLAHAGAAETVLIGAAGVGVVSASLVAAPGWSGAAGVVLAGLMSAIAIVDRSRLVIPDELNGAAFIAGLAAAGLWADAPREEAILDSLLRAGLMFSLFFVFRIAYRKARGMEGMGLGDVKLAAAAGAWLDWAWLPIAVDIAALSALAVALVRRFYGVGLDPKAKLPFGAYFAPAIWFCWLLAALRGDWPLN